MSAHVDAEALGPTRYREYGYVMLHLSVDGSDVVLAEPRCADVPGKARREKLGEASRAFLKVCAAAGRYRLEKDVLIRQR